MSSTMILDTFSSQIPIINRLFRIPRLITFSAYLIFAVQAQVFNPDTPGETKAVVCKDKGLPVQFKNPFSQFQKSSEFVLLEWFKGENASAEVSIMTVSKGEGAIVTADRVSVFDSWGIQFDPVEFEDFNIYKAVLLTTNLDPQTRVVKVSVASAPKLISKSLSVSIEKEGKSRFVTCGHVASLGTPPIEIVLMADNGTILPSTYNNGFLRYELDPSITEGKFHCSIGGSSPAAECIADPTQWDSFISLGKSTMAADITGIIAGTVVGAVFLLVVMIVIFLCIRRRGKEGPIDDEMYDRKSDAMQPMNPAPESRYSGYGDEDERPYLSSKASSASPYMVTGLKLNDNINHYASGPSNRAQKGPGQIYKAPVATADEDYEDTYRKPQKGANAHDRRSWAGGEDKRGQQQPPVPMKRHKHFTVSKEGLDLIDSSGGGAAIGTTV